MNDDCLQESVEEKRLWALEMSTKFPVGDRVHVTASDLPEYIGLMGTVSGYDLGINGDYPLISVAFDTPVIVSKHHVARDGFYEDELWNCRNE